MELMQAYLDIFDHFPKKKVQDMYSRRFIRSLRFTKCDDITFIKGRVSAEMRKSCVYVVDVSLDKYGAVQQTQCECAVGQGPQAHCKHVCLVLYALTK